MASEDEKKSPVTAPKRTQDTKFDNVEVAIKQICKASFSAAEINCDFEEQFDVQTSMKVYCCIYTRVDSDLFYMIFVLNSISIMISRERTRHIFEMYEHEGYDFVTLKSPFQKLERSQLRHIKDGGLVLCESSSFMRVYCGEKTYKELVKDGLFDGNIYVTGYTGDIEAPI